MWEALLLGPGDGVVRHTYHLYVACLVLLSSERNFWEWTYLVLGFWASILEVENTDQKWACLGLVMKGTVVE